MCRLFGMLSVKGSHAKKYLLEDPCSIYIQSKANPNKKQGDGWGIGFYIDDAPKVIRSEKPVYKESGEFASAVSAATSKAVLAHIRRASNPRGLPREKLLSVENSQPFTYGRYSFAHNGTITMPDEVAECLGEWKEKVRGLNDSEVYFWYIVKEMTSGASFPEAIEGFVEALSILWQRTKSRPKYDRPYIGLNALLSDGSRLYAFCKYDAKDESKVSLCLRDQPAFQMSYLADSTRLIVVSEKTNREEKWQALESGQLLTGQILGDTLRVSIQEI